MRRSAHLICVTVLLVGFLTSSAAAQQSTQAGTIAAGGDLGVFFPDEAFEKTFTIDAFGEYYVTPSISIRGLLGWASPGFENFTEDKFRQTKLLFNGVYYWQHDKWLPYATGGAGFYFLRQLFENAPDPDSEVRGGLNFGVGTEYLLGAGGSVKGELRWDIVSQPTGFPDATGLSLMFGYKRYF
jgi:Outer membrane protein beta-barrel domain